MSFLASTTFCACVRLFACLPCLHLNGVKGGGRGAWSESCAKKKEVLGGRKQALSRKLLAKGLWLWRRQGPALFETLCVPICYRSCIFLCKVIGFVVSIFLLCLCQRGMGVDTW